MTERKKQTTSFDLNQLLDADFFKKPYFQIIVNFREENLLAHLECSTLKWTLFKGENYEKYAM